MRHFATLILALSAVLCLGAPASAGDGAAAGKAPADAPAATQTAKGTLGNVDSANNTVTVKVTTTTGKKKTTDTLVLHVLPTTTITSAGAAVPLSGLKAGASVTVGYTVVDASTDNAVSIDVSAAKDKGKGGKKKK
jgi:hypothetical protein